jgi:Flp pilus assembly pilin Flp
MSATQHHHATRKILVCRARERGMSTVEYVILLVAIVVGAIGLWKSIGKELKTGLTNAEQDFTELNKK